ncbi:MAG: hypothetical protein JSV31_23100 [Desulfobacterales bacterium]|nr:MAG: hypothetical protein JSV31_23100 [Desulfobacterales bacterium]
MNTRVYMRSVASILFIMVVYVWLFGCGAKDLPVPPRREKPPAVKDLSYRIEDHNLALAWTIPKKDKRRQSNLAGFKVYAAKVPLSESDCKNCPLRFIEVGDIPIPKKREQEQITFFQTLESGYRYVFMIRGYSDDGMVSVDSNYVDFVHE